MFRKKTVFILGAGASWHYGYPTGEELVQKVKEKAWEIVKEYQQYFTTTPSSTWQRYPKHYTGGNFNPFFQKIFTIKEKIERANPLVIDDFLGRNKDIADVGKLLIAMVLLECEKTAQIRSGNKDEKGSDTGKGDWVRYVVQQLTVDCEKPEDLLANNVKFVTFNYDISLEQRLCAALYRYQWFCEDGFSKRFFEPGRFHHVYGQLTNFDTFCPIDTPPNYNNAFEVANEIDRAWDCSLALGKDGKPRLRTISPDEKTAAPEIVQAIAEAEYLYFLGYGFDSRNNELLKLGQRPNQPNQSSLQYVYFTNFGNHNQISKSVERTFHLTHGEFIEDLARPYGDLLGDHYVGRSNSQYGGAQYRCEKSIKSVYDALAEDFDWPE